MENLTSDIVREILSRLPKTETGFKSVLQCREVCKLWENLLGKPKTGTIFTKSSEDIRGPVKLYYREQSCEMVTAEGKQNFDKVTTEMGVIGDMSSFNMVGSFNGLVCYETQEVIYIFNPITGERICLSSDKKEEKKRKRIMDGCFESAGFGYCHSTDEYKVVKICCLDNGKLSVQVYTLGDGSGWREKPDIAYDVFKKRGVFANGALHWLNYKYNCDIIVAFDLEDETFRRLPLPPPCPMRFTSNMKVNLGSFEGNLYLCLRYVKRDENMMDIWVLKKKNTDNCRRSTRLKPRTYFTWFELFSRKWDSRSKCQLLSSTESEILLWQDDVLSCYDPTTFKKIWYAGAERYGGYQAISHMHSLVSLKDLGEVLVGPSEGHPKSQ